MDGVRVVRMEDVLSSLDILLTATGHYITMYGYMYVVYVNMCFLYTSTPFVGCR